MAEGELLMRTIIAILTIAFAGAEASAQGRRRVFSEIMTGEPYTLECYLP